MVNKADKDAKARPAQAPFGYFRAEPFGWTDCAEGDEGAVALYEHPLAAQPEQEPEWKQIAEDLRFHGLTLVKTATGYAVLKLGVVQAQATPPAAQPEPKGCVWSPDDDDTMPGTYHSACGELWLFIDGTWQENRVRFCHGCGGRVEAAHGIKESKP